MERAQICLATLKRDYQLMPALKWLRRRLNHIPGKYEHLLRCYGYYSNRSRGARTLAEQGDDPSATLSAQYSSNNDNTPH